MVTDVIINFVNLLIAAVGALIKTLINILPTTPFQSDLYLSFVNGISDYLPGLNWIIPIESISMILSIWLVAIGIYYLVAIALRWAKAIS